MLNEHEKGELDILKTLLINESGEVKTVGVKKELLDRYAFLIEKEKILQPRDPDEPIGLTIGGVITYIVPGKHVPQAKDIEAEKAENLIKKMEEEGTAVETPE